MTSSTRPGHGVNAETHRTASGHTCFILPLGFQTPPLSLNDPTPRGKRARGARAGKVRSIRAAVHVRAQQLGMHRLPPIAHLHVELHYVPRDKRARDADNLVATMKPAIDALTAKGQGQGWIALGLVPDDTPEWVSWSPPVIHLPDEHGPRMWLELTVLPSAPAPIGQAYGVTDPNERLDHDQ